MCGQHTLLLKRVLFMKRFKSIEFLQAHFPVKVILDRNLVFGAWGQVQVETLSRQ